MRNSLRHDTFHSKGKFSLHKDAYGQALRAGGGNPIIRGAAGTLQTLGGLIGYGGYMINKQYYKSFAALTSPVQSEKHKRMMKMLTEPRCSDIFMSAMMSYLIGLGHHSFTETLMAMQSTGFARFIPSVISDYEDAFEAYTSLYTPSRLNEEAEGCLLPQSRFRTFVIDANEGICEGFPGEKEANVRDSILAMLGARGVNVESRTQMQGQEALLSFISPKLE